MTGFDLFVLVNIFILYCKILWDYFDRPFRYLPKTVADVSVKQIQEIPFGYISGEICRLRRDDRKIIITAVRTDKVYYKCFHTKDEFDYVANKFKARIAVDDRHEYTASKEDFLEAVKPESNAAKAVDEVNQLSKMTVNSYE